MTLEQVEYFVAAVEAGSFSGAAGRLFVSHSSVSRGVAMLESELGVTLLIRGKRRLTCTEAGEAFFREGRVLLRQARTAKESVEKYRQKQRLQLISVGMYAPRFFELCREFRETHPDVELALEQADLRTSVEALRNGAADMSATFSYAVPEKEGFETLTLEQGLFCALVSPDHELADREWIDSRELTERKDILGANPFQSGRESRHGPLPDLQSILLQIKVGNGITVLPEHAAAEFGQGCVRIPIRGVRTEYRLVLVWRRTNRSRVLVEAVAFFRQRLK